jgi:hypothetical protein
MTESLVVAWLLGAPAAEHDCAQQGTQLPLLRTAQVLPLNATTGSTEHSCMGHVAPLGMHQCDMLHLWACNN